ncbi:uncharacterized protein BO72DRAFT_388869, partial [Aspergillus fijiensis CBS 313.89]
LFDTSPSAMAETERDADATMRHAITQFRHKMETANRRFLQDRVTEIEGLHLPTEAAKLQRMRDYWDHLGIGGPDPHWNHLVSPGPVREDREVRGVTSLAEVPSLYHQYMDGVCPPRLRTEAWRQMYLETFHEVCSAAVADDGQAQEADAIPRCEELVLFLKYANGVCDPDFRRLGIAPFVPGFYIGVPEYAFVEEGAEREVEGFRDLEAQREALRGYLEDSLLGQVGLHGTIDDDLEVKVGFLIGCGGWMHEDRWYSAYAYCRVIGENGTDSAYGHWAWRVVFFEASEENPATLYGRRPLFDSIPEFLEWYCSWPDYVDMRQVRRNALGDYT